MTKQFTSLKQKRANLYKTNPISELVYQFVVSFIERENCPPTISEISDGCYMSRNTVVRHLDKLEAQGRLYRIPHKFRGLRLLPLSQSEE